MIRRLLQGLAHHASQALAGTKPEHRELHGIRVWVLNDREHASTEALFGKAAEALDRIAGTQPWRIGMMRRDFARIFIRQNTGCRALFDATRSCVLDTFFVATFSPAQVAASIVHESVHARLRSGGRAVPADLIAWEERLCRRAELGFGMRVPDGAAVVDRARAALTLSDADVAPLAGGIHHRPTRRRGGR